MPIMPYTQEKFVEQSVLRKGFNKINYRIILYLYIKVQPYMGELNLIITGYLPIKCIVYINAGVVYFYFSVIFDKLKKIPNF